MLSVLHTWNGRLGYHPHVHLLDHAGGGITPMASTGSRHGESSCVPVFVLSRKIAAQFARPMKA